MRQDYSWMADYCAGRITNEWPTTVQTGLFVDGGLLCRAGIVMVSGLLCRARLLMAGGLLITNHIKLV